jgi:hypothetical protein
MNNRRDDQIRRRAHQIWEREGRQHGQHEKHWHQASREVDDEEASEHETGREPANSNADARLTDDHEPTVPEAPQGEAVTRTKRARTPRQTSGKAAKATSKPGKASSVTKG